MGLYKDAMTYHSEALKIARDEKYKISEAGAINWIANSLASLGKVQEAITQFEFSLKLSKEIGSKENEGHVLNNLGNCYAKLGDMRKSIKFYEQSVDIACETGDRRNEGIRVSNLGNIYSSLGDFYKSIEFFDQSLVIAREISHPRSECANLNSLGSVYDGLGEAQKAIGYYEQALKIAQEIGDREEEGSLLGNIAEERINLGEYELAIQSAEQYIKICEEITKPASYAFDRLAQAYLYKTEFIKARDAIEAALQYDVPENNHNTTALHGIIALRQGERETAQEAFTKSIAQADEILAKTPDYYDALDAKGLSICGLLICDLRLAGRGDPSMPAETNVGKAVSPEKSTVSAGWVAPTLNDAIETFRKARKIAPHAGVVKSVLRLFDELVKCDEEGVLKGVRKAAEGV
jgi:tetratricopeptide (TPR) repeat protein